MQQRIEKHSDHTWHLFLKRTVSAQLHLLGCILATAGLFILLHFANTNPDRSHFWACFAFGVTSILVFGASTVYHFVVDGFKISEKLSLWLEDLDHFAIFLFIAGTYSPVLLNVILPPWNTILLFFIWSVAVTGVVYTHFKPKLPRWAQHRAFYTSIFVLMGWTLIVRLQEAIAHLSAHGLFLLVAGGLSYTFGAVIYALKRPNFFKGLFGFHEIWHVMVMIGFGFHYFLILSFYRPDF